MGWTPNRIYGLSILGWGGLKEPQEAGSVSFPALINNRSLIGIIIMKNKYFLSVCAFATLAISFILSCLPSIAVAASEFMPRPIYENVFTTKIYDQEVVLEKLKSKIETRTISDQELDKEMENALLKAKQECLGETILKQIEDKIQIYTENEQQSVRLNLLKCITTGMAASMAAVPLYALTPIGIGAVIRGLAVFASILPGISTTLTACFSSEKEIGLKKQIAELQKKAEFWMEGLDQENIRDFELDYIKKKRTITNEKLKAGIETALIEARKHQDIYSGGVIKGLLTGAILLPTAPKDLWSNRAVGSLETDFNNNTFFHGFSEKTRNELIKFANEIVYASRPQEIQNIPNRAVRYFYGPPGCGKTTCAEEIARFLNLSYFETTIIDAAELSKGNLLGTTCWTQNANVGWLAKPLLATDTSGKTYSNSILIINEFDKIFSTQSGASVGLSFLLDFLDPSKKSIESAFFGTDLDISRISVIITGNSELPHENALRSRLKNKIIEFPSFEPEKLKEIIRNHIPEEKKFWHIPENLQIELRNTDKKLSLGFGYDQNFLENYECEVLFNADPVFLNLDIYGLPRSSPRESFAEMRDVFNEWKLVADRVAKRCYDEAKVKDNEVATPQDWQTVVSLYKKAVLYGDTKESAFELGKYYKKEKNNALSKVWFEMAAKNGHVEAAYETGLSYDAASDEAKQWMMIAANKGHPGARRWMVAELSRSEKSEDLELASAYIEALLQAGTKGQADWENDLRSLHKLGIQFENIRLQDRANDCNLAAFKNGSVPALYKLVYQYFYQGKTRQSLISWKDKDQDKTQELHEFTNLGKLCCKLQTYSWNKSDESLLVNDDLSKVLERILSETNNNDIKYQSCCAGYNCLNATPADVGEYISADISYMIAVMLYYGNGTQYQSYVWFDISKNLNKELGNPNRYPPKLAKYPPKPGECMEMKFVAPSK